MKNLILLLCLLPLFAIAQNQSGSISYKETIKLNIEIPKEAEAFKDLFPTSQSVNKILYFDTDKSLYSNVAKSAEDTNYETETEGGMAQVQIKMSNSESKIFTNLKTQERLQSEELFGKKFLINSQVKKRAWKIVQEQKEILGYNCMKAVYKDTLQDLVVWFTPQIPVAVGPSSFSGLPGAILAMSVNEDEITIAATKVSLESIEAKFLEQPKKGKKVTAAEFEKIEEEKMKEMQEMYGGKGNTIIRVERN